MSMKIPCYFQVKTASSCATVGMDPWRSPDAPQCLEALAVVAVRTTVLHRLDARSSYSEFYTNLDFKRHKLGMVCQTSGGHGNTSGRYPVFQNILYGCGNEWQRWPSGRSINPFGCGPVLGRNALFWKGGRWRPSGRYLSESEFDQN